MNKILTIMVLTLLMVGCNGEDHKKASTQPSVSGTVYQGQIEGCKQHWDELLCGARTINAGNEEPKVDNNGSYITLDLPESNATKVWK